MSKFNKNNPTDLWTEDERYKFGKLENKWLKSLPRCRFSSRKNGLARDCSDPTFTSMEEINEIMEKYIEIKKQRWKYLCHICDYGSKMKGNLNAHLNATHRLGKRHKCDKCVKEYYGKGSLLAHIKMKHRGITEVGTHKCTKCDKTYSRQNSLKDHMLAIHDEKPFRCDRCPKKYASQISLACHIRNIHVQKLHKCHLCVKKFKNKLNLSAHIKTHEPKSVKCGICTYSAMSNGNLNSHMGQVHYKEKNWSCNICPFSTYAKGTLVIHKRIHTGEKPYKCKKCKRKFAQNGGLKAHKCTAL